MVNTPPKVSIVIPTFNRSLALKFTLQSVLLQDFTDFEILVVGDGCTDDSEAVVASFGDSRLKWTNLPQNSGTPSKPRNEALKKAQGRLIAYLGHDDLWFPWHLSQLIQNLEKNGSDFAYSLGALIKPGGVAGIFSLPQKSKNPIWTLSPSNWLHRSDLLERTGGWPPINIWASDMMFLQKIWKANAKLSFSPSLSVLKFTASTWGMYKLESQFPQKSYMEALSRDPEALRLEILHDASSTIAALGKGLHRKERIIRDIFRKTIMFSFNHYGIHRWPVNQLMRQRWRKRAGLD